MPFWWICNNHLRWCICLEKVLRLWIKKTSHAMAHLPVMCSIFLLLKVTKIIWLFSVYLMTGIKILTHGQFNFPYVNNKHRCQQVISNSWRSVNHAITHLRGQVWEERFNLWLFLIRINEWQWMLMKIRGAHLDGKSQLWSGQWLKKKIYNGDECLVLRLIIINLQFNELSD